MEAFGNQEKRLHSEAEFVMYELNSNSLFNPVAKLSMNTIKISLD